MSQGGMEAGLRRATAADVPTIERVVRAAYATYVPRMGREPGPMGDDYAARVREGRVQVLEEGETVIGVLVTVPRADHLLLDNVAVAPEAQGRGIGRRLIAAAEATARNGGYATIRLYTHETMTENLERYTRLGYVETHRVEEKGLKRVYMAKALA